MKKRRERSFIAVAVCFVFLSIVSCSLTLNYHIDKLKDLQVASPLGKVTPRTFLVNSFHDGRNIKDDVFFVHLHKWKSDIPITEIVSDAITTELVRNGHKCTKAEDKEGVDFVLDGNVFEYFVYLDYPTVPGFGLFMLTAKTGVRIILTPRDAARGNFTQKYKGIYYDRFFSARGNQAAECINEALGNMVEEFATDPELVEFLRKN